MELQPSSPSSPEYIHIFDIKSFHFYILLGAQGPLILQETLCLFMGRPTLKNSFESADVSPRTPVRCFRETSHGR